MHLFIDLVQALAGLIAAVGGAIGLIFGAVKIAPRILDNARTALELSAALERERIAAEAAKSYRLAAEGWQARVLQLNESINDLKSEFAASIVYIVELIVFLKKDRRADDAPPIPDNLQHLIDEGLRKREAPRASGGSAA